MKNELITFLVSALPLVELRGGLPLGVGLGLNISEAVIWAFLGNWLAVMFVLWFLPIVVNFADAHWKWLHELLLKIFAKTRTKHGAKVQKWKNLALILFVAIPIPGTGGWTGALVAYLFGVPFKTAGKLLTIGLAISAIVMMIIVGGFTWIF